MEYDEFTGGLEGDEFAGGWAPAEYLSGDFADGMPFDYHKRKNGRYYMDITDWANRKWTEQAERDPALEKIYLSAKMMKWHSSSQRTSERYMVSLQALP